MFGVAEEGYADGTARSHSGFANPSVSRNPQISLGGPVLVRRSGFSRGSVREALGQ